MEEKVRKLIKYIAMNAAQESHFLYPEPEWNLNANDLLHEITKIWGLSQSEVSHMIDETNEEQ
jgi:hypothetical protein